MFGKREAHYKGVISFSAQKSQQCAHFSPFRTPMLSPVQRVIVPAESEDTGPMRRLILRTVATVVLVVGTPAALFAAPISQPHERAAIHSTDSHVQRMDYYSWNHHHYAHRDWDRHHNRWHYYD